MYSDADALLQHDAAVLLPRHRRARSGAGGQGKGEAGGEATNWWRMRKGNTTVKETTTTQQSNVVVLHCVVEVRRATCPIEHGVAVAVAVAAVAVAAAVVGGHGDAVAVVVVVMVEYAEEGGKGRCERSSGIWKAANRVAMSWHERGDGVPELVGAARGSDAKDRRDRIERGEWTGMARVAATE